MPTYEEIEKKFREFGLADDRIVQWEMKALPQILWEDEVLEQVIKGMYQGRNGVLCATNKRLVFVDKGLFSNLRVEDFPYDRVTSIQYDVGWVFGGIQIFVAGNAAELSMIPKHMTKPFAEYVRARITSASGHAATAQKPVESSVQKVDALERLAKLKEQGLLTEEEFQDQKKAILSL